MTLSKFNAAFGIKADIGEEKRRFVERINQSVFSALYSNPYPDSLETVFRNLCYGFGVDAGPRIARENDQNYGYSTRIPSIRTLTGDDFMETLKVLTLLREVVHEENVQFIDNGIEFALATVATDLGVRYVDGMFYPSGAKELDERLIEDNLKWLEVYPSVRTQFGTTLEHFQRSLTDEAARKDTITNAYASVEDLTQKILGNSKNFENNSDLLVAHLSLPKEYKNIIHYYKQMAHEYSSRHAGSTFSHVETEGFVYLTGILMRLMLGKATQ